MKLFLVVLLAGVWSTTAFPQIHPFEQYELDLPNIENFNNAGEVLKCIQTAIDRVIEESDLGPIWDETKEKLYQAVSVELPKCAAITNKLQKLKCRATVAKNVGDVLAAFMKELANVNKWELVQEIKDKVLTFCFNQQGGMIEAENEIEQFEAPVPSTFLARFECLAKALEAVSKTYGLESLWSKSKPQLEHRLSQWKQCQTVQNAVFRYFCEAKEAAFSFQIVTEYVKLAGAQEPKFVQTFVAYYKEHCAGNSYDDEVAELFDAEEFGVNPSYYERFACVAKSLDTVSKAHGLQSLWEKPQADIERHLGHWKKCLTSSNPVYATICQVKAGVESFITMTQYVKAAAAQDAKFVEDFAADYKKNCAGQSYAYELTETFVFDGLKACIEKLVQKVKCVNQVINESVQGTDFEAVWTEAQNNLTHLQNKLAKCAESQEAAKCVAETLKESYSLFAKFLKHLKQANYDAYKKIQGNIKKKCFTA